MVVILILYPELLIYTKVINKLVVYQCKSCLSKVKKTKCSSEVKEVPYCTICQKDMEVFVLKVISKLCIVQ